MVALSDAIGQTQPFWLFPPRCPFAANFAQLEAWTLLDFLDFASAQLQVNLVQKNACRQQQNTNDDDERQETTEVKAV